jgi:hypothetical protein
MTDRRTMRVDASTALAAALLIGIQTLLMSMSLGVHAAPGQAGLFVGSLCSSHGSSGHVPTDGHSLPDCCALGCALASGSPLPGPMALLFVPVPSTPVAYGSPKTSLPAERERSSIRSRGPPGLG